MKLDKTQKCESLFCFSPTCLFVDSRRGRSAHSNFIPWHIILSYVGHQKPKVIRKGGKQSCNLTPYKHALCCCGEGQGSWNGGWGGGWGSSWAVGSRINSLRSVKALSPRKLIFRGTKLKLASRACGWWQNYSQKLKKTVCAGQSVKLTQVLVIWQEGTSTEKNASISVACGRVWGAFSWLMMGVGGPCPLSVAISLGRVSWVV